MNEVPKKLASMLGVVPGMSRVLGQTPRLGQGQCLGKLGFWALRGWFWTFGPHGPLRSILLNLGIRNLSIGLFWAKIVPLRIIILDLGILGPFGEIRSKSEIGQ